MRDWVESRERRKCSIGETVKAPDKPVNFRQTCKHLQRGFASRRIFTPLVIKIKETNRVVVFGMAWHRHPPSRTFRRFRPNEKPKNTSWLKRPQAMGHLGVAAPRQDLVAAA